MAKTALELTKEEWRAYHPVASRQDQGAEERRTRAWKAAQDAARLLREQFETLRVAAYGSLVRREGFTAWSDIDLAAWGIPADRFFGAVSLVAGSSQEFEIALVDPEACPPGLRGRIEHEGIAL